MGGEFFQFIHRGFGMYDLNELNFVKLVHADDATIVATSTSGFTAEARGVTRHFDGKVFFRKEGITVEVGDGHFASRDEEHCIVFDTVHIVFKLGELGRADHTFALYDMRNVDFFVSVFTGLKVEEKLNEGTLEAGPFPAVDGEA